MSVKQELIKAKALIADPKNWTQSCLARNAGDMHEDVMEIFDKAIEEAS